MIGESYSHVLAWNSDDYSESDLSGELMNFRLVYEGQLKATSQGKTRAAEKHEIRRALHPQLKELWAQHSVLRSNALGAVEKTLGHDYNRCGHRFVPVVLKRLSLVCYLDILILRREEPGNLIRNGGDLDNRLKTLFDGLRIPDDCSEIGEPSDDEKPYLYCLLESDAQIVGFNITTDRLLKPLRDGQKTDDVVVIIRARIRSTQGNIPGFPLA